MTHHACDFQRAVDLLPAPEGAWYRSSNGFVGQCDGHGYVSASLRPNPSCWLEYSGYERFHSSAGEEVVVWEVRRLPHSERERLEGDIRQGGRACSSIARGDRVALATIPSWWVGRG